MIEGDDFIVVGNKLDLNGLPDSVIENALQIDRLEAALIYFEQERPVGSLIERKKVDIEMTSNNSTVKILKMM